MAAARRPAQAFVTPATTRAKRFNVLRAELTNVSSLKEMFPICCRTKRHCNVHELFSHHR
jgi:hypothetical protein